MLRKFVKKEMRINALVIWKPLVMLEGAGNFLFEEECNSSLTPYI
jgi:hypothetical protein